MIYKKYGYQRLRGFLDGMFLFCFCMCLFEILKTIIGLSIIAFMVFVCIYNFIFFFKPMWHLVFGNIIKLSDFIIDELKQKKRIGC